MSAYLYKIQVEIVVASMALHNYIRRSQDDEVFLNMITIPISFHMTFYLLLYLAHLFKDRRDLQI